MSEASSSFSPFALHYFLRSFFVILVLAICAESLPAQTPEDAVRDLARRAAEVREIPQALSVEWRNESSLPEAESIILRGAFLKEFSLRHPVGGDPSRSAAPSWTLLLSIRETPTSFLVVAQVPAAAGVQVRMAELPRTAFLPVMTRGNGFRLAHQLLWQQGETVLDAEEFALGNAAEPNIFLLKPDAVAIYRQDEERLGEVQQLPFTGYRYVSRGLRAEMFKDPGGTVAIALPGLHCNLRPPASNSERWSMSCAAVAPTNMFEQDADSGDANKPRTAVQKLADASSAASPSDVQSVALSAACQPGSWRLVSQATDWTQPDKLLLVSTTMKREEAVAAVDFAGPVQRLTLAEDGKSALAVVFDLASGSYDVYRVSMVCGQ